MCFCDDIHAGLNIPDFPLSCDARRAEKHHQALAGECPMVSAAALIGVTLSSWSRVEHLALRSLQATK